MIRINIHEAKTQLSRHLAKVEKEGITIVICRRNVPIAEIRALPRSPSKPRKVGPLKGSFQVPEGFFDPLPEELLTAFEGSRNEIP